MICGCTTSTSQQGSAADSKAQDGLQCSKTEIHHTDMQASLRDWHMQSWVTTASATTRKQAAQVYSPADELRRAQSLTSVCIYT